MKAVLRPPIPPKRRGFTYLMLLWWVAIGGVMLAAVGQSWRLESRRQRDLELAFRGEQIRVAIEAYRSFRPEGRMDLPRQLTDLVVDKRGGEPQHHLRRLWPDPVTGGEWGLVLAEGRISGVFSTSTATPLRGPLGVESYGEWRFEVGPAVDTPPLSDQPAP